MTRRRAWLWVGQGALALAVVGLAGRTLVRHWEDFRRLDVALSIRAPAIVAAAVVVLFTYGALIEAWRRVLGGWGQSLRFSAAARIWALSNLGRYLPGKIWTVAGLAVLAQRAGVSPWAATASSGAMQVLALGTGVALTAATIPLNVPGLPSGAALTAAVAVMVATVLTLTSPTVSGWLGRRLPRLDIRPLSPGAVVAGTAITASAWLAYGLAFWLLARGMFDAPGLGYARAVGVFAAGYITGLLSLFAPGGFGVREAIFLTLLRPTMGASDALALTVGSRILLTLTESVAALGGVLIRSGPKETGVDAD